MTDTDWDPLRLPVVAGLSGEGLAEAVARDAAMLAYLRDLAEAWLGMPSPPAPATVDPLIGYTL